MKFLIIYPCGIFAWHFLYALSDTQKVTYAIEQRSWNEIFQLKDLKDNVAVYRKAPKFMMELYDVVSESNGTLKKTNVLEGNIVRSFEGAYNGCKLYG